MSTHPSALRLRFRLYALTTGSLILVTGAGCPLPPGSQLPKPPSGTCSLPTPPTQNSRIQPRLQGSYLAAPTQAAATRHLLGHVPAAATAASDLGALSDSQSIDFTISLSLNHVDELEALISALHDPTSARYGRYLTPDEFSERFGPTAEQKNQVLGFLEANGIEVTSITANRKLIRAHGSHSAIARAFATEVHQYAQADGSRFFAPKYELALPAGVPIEAVHGLHNLSQYRPHAHERAIDFIHPLTTGTGPGGGITPADLRAAYRFPATSSYSGSGQTLALFELDGYKASDITQYEKAYSLPAVPLTNVLVDGASGTSGSGAGEVTLDIELMIAAAPGASRVIIYEGPNSEQGVIDTYNRIATDNLAKSVSTSWGEPEAQSSSAAIQAENSIFMQMAAQGQTIYAASGDSGAYDDGRTVSVDDPGTQPYVVSVGGTRLSTDSSGNYQTETTWNNGSPQGGAGGGGISQLWSIPGYQTGVAAAATGSGVSTRMRNVPDVSLDADPQTGYSIYFKGQWTIFGGTSCAAPIWAGFTALVNEARQSHGLSSLGLAHTVLYPLALQASSFAADFNDISDSSTNLFFRAVAGYDDATGLGSFIADGLLSDLAQVPRPPVPVSSSPVTGAPTCANTQR